MFRPHHSSMFSHFNMKIWWFVISQKRIPIFNNSLEMTVNLWLELFQTKDLSSNMFASTARWEVMNPAFKSSFNICHLTVTKKNNQTHRTEDIYWIRPWHSNWQSQSWWGDCCGWCWGGCREDQTPPGDRHCSSRRMLHTCCYQTVQYHQLENFRIVQFVEHSSIPLTSAALHWTLKILTCAHWTGNSLKSRRHYFFYMQNNLLFHFEIFASI